MQDPPVPQCAVLTVFVQPAISLFWAAQAIYYLVVEVLRRQRFVRDPEVMTSFRELSRKSAKVNSPWWRLSGVFGESHRFHMFCLYQALFTVCLCNALRTRTSSWYTQSAPLVSWLVSAVFRADGVSSEVAPELYCDCTSA